MKKRNRVVLFVLVVGAAMLVYSRGWASPAIEQIVSRISQDQYEVYVQNLEDFGTRYYFAPQNETVAAYIHDEFASFGLEVSYHVFTYFGNQTFKNVVATIPGITNPDEIYIVSAHFDSTGEFPSTYAPGADDNASGTGAILEIARVLSQYKFANTIKFIAFNLEEVLCAGSEIYADEAKARGDDIVALIDLDMIAYAPRANKDLEVIGNRWLRNRIQSNADQYTTLTTQSHSDVPLGDALWFHSSNYPGSASVLCIEDTPDQIYGGSNPYFGTDEDTFDRLNFEFASDVVRAIAASMADLAVVATPADLAEDVPSQNDPPEGDILPVENPPASDPSAEVPPSENPPVVYPVITDIMPSPCYPEEVVQIYGSNFGESQGLSTIHLNRRTYDATRPRIRFWSDTEIELKIPKFKCASFKQKDGRNPKIWVTVDGQISNTWRVEVKKQTSCP
jgi:hypothetical protein